MLKILIADDHAIVREGLKQILSEIPDMAVIDEATCGAEAIRMALINDYDVIVLDISMPDKGGLDVLKQIKAHKPKQHVLILSMYPEEQYAFRILKAGASGYLTKESAPDELITAINRVAKGMKYVSSHLTEVIASSLDFDAEKPVQETLSDREFQVLCLIASGKKVKDIAHELCINAKSVNAYRLRLLEKMKMKGNAELTHFAIKKQLVF